MSDVSPDYLMGCVSALTNLVALVAKELPREQREPIIDRIAQLQAAVELRWKDAPEKGPMRSTSASTRRAACFSWYP
jgi:hypothetical protein